MLITPFILKWGGAWKEVAGVEFPQASDQNL